MKKYILIGVIIFVVIFAVIIITFMNKNKDGNDNPCANFQCGNNSGPAKDDGKGGCMCPNCDLCNKKGGHANINCTSCTCNECKECEDDFGNPITCDGMLEKRDNKCDCVYDESYCDMDNTVIINKINENNPDAAKKITCECRQDLNKECTEKGQIVNKRCKCIPKNCSTGDVKCNENQMCGVPKDTDNNTLWPFCYNICDENNPCNSTSEQCVMGTHSIDNEKDKNICVSNICYSITSPDGIIKCKETEKCIHGSCMKKCKNNNDCTNTGEICSSDEICTNLNCGNNSDPSVQILYNNNIDDFPDNKGTCTYTCRLSSDCKTSPVIDKTSCNNDKTSCGCNKDIIGCEDKDDENNFVYVLDLDHTLEEAKNSGSSGCDNLIASDITLVYDDPTVQPVPWGDIYFPDNLAQSLKYAMLNNDTQVIKLLQSPSDNRLFNENSQLGIGYMVINGDVDDDVTKTYQSYLKNWPIWNNNTWISPKRLLVLRDNKCIKNVYFRKIPYTQQDDFIGKNLRITQSGTIPRI